MTWTPAVESFLLKVKNHRLACSGPGAIGTEGYRGHISTGTSVFKKGTSGCGELHIGFFLEVMHSICTYMSLVKANHVAMLMLKGREVQPCLISYPGGGKKTHSVQGQQ